MPLKRNIGAGIALAFSVLLMGAPGVAQAQGLRLIRDAEIESDLARMTAPILETAGLGANSVRIYIVQDDQLNAFVAGGMNLFLNTGLIMRSENAGQLMGVVAHEVGHIAGGHLSRVPEAQEQAIWKALGGAVLGAAAALAGAPQLGTAIVGAGQTAAQYGLATFSQGQEQAADQAAVTYLVRSGVSPAGLAQFFRVLENQNVLVGSNRSPYLQSHPLTRDRVLFVENQASRGPPPDQLPPGWETMHARMVVKLQAFLGNPRDVLRRYDGDDSLTGRYARAIALYRLPDLAQALATIDGLLADYPDDPYFHELKGQMLFENGRIEAAIPPYRESVRLRPEAALLRIGLAQALIESGNPGSNQEAMDDLEEALDSEPTNATAWRLLGITQGRDGQEGKSFYSLAEYALLVGNLDDARLYVSRAKNKLDPADPAWLRLEDLERELEG